MDATTLLLRQIADEQAVQGRWIAAGNAKDFADYQRVCGVIQGLARAENLVKDLVQKMERNDDE
mgnify:CR=1 FL=1